MEFLAKTYCVPNKPAAKRIMQQSSQQSQDECKSLTDFETMTVVYENTIIEKNNLAVIHGGRKKYEPLSTFKDAYLDQILENIDKYLPQGKLDTFSIFDNREWGEDLPVAEILAESEAKLKELSTMYGIAYEPAILYSWQVLLEKIKEDGYTFCSIRNSMPVAFWMKMLNQYTINPKLQKIILASIVIPYGSAEAERAFSAMNRIKRNERTLLKSDTLGLFT